MKQIKIKQGKYYKTRCGIVVGPIKIQKNGTNYRFGANLKEPEYDDYSPSVWLEDGKYLCSYFDHKYELIEELNQQS